MPYFWLILALLIALFDWLAVARDWRKIEAIAKPAVMLALLAWVYQHSAFQGAALWVALGLIFCLAGDIFLLPQTNKFMAGLASFLVGYAIYGLSLNSTPPPLNLASLVLLALLAVLGVAIYRRLSAAPALQRSSTLRTAVGVYAAVISLMLLSALLTLVRPEWIAAPALCVAGGALLLYFSDIVLAWGRFLDPLPHGRLLVMTTYHLGQILFVYGAIWQFTA